MSNLNAVQQGVAVVEPSGDGYLLMLPSGDVSFQPTRAAVVRRAKEWARANLKHVNGDLGVMNLEWR